MKKLISILIITLLFVFAFVGCGGSSDNSVPSSSDTISTVLSSLHNSQGQSAGSIQTTNQSSSIATSVGQSSSQNSEASLLKYQSACNNIATTIKGLNNNSANVLTAKPFAVKVEAEKVSQEDIVVSGGQLENQDGGMVGTSGIEQETSKNPIISEWKSRTETTVSSETNNSVSTSIDMTSEPIHIPADMQGYMMIKGVSIFVKMLGEMMTNSNFVLTDNVVQFIASYTNSAISYEETFSANLYYSFNEQTNKIIMIWDVDSVVNGSQSKIFLSMDIDYNFQNEILEGFHIKTIQQGISLSCKYYDGNVTYWFATNPSLVSSYAWYFANEQEQINSKIPTAINLNADFSVEYGRAMDFMNS